MPSPIAQDKRNDITIKLMLGRDPQMIAEEEHVSLRSVQRFKRNIIHHGHTYAARDGPQGRRRLITSEMEEVYAKHYFDVGSSQLPYYTPFRLC